MSSAGVPEEFKRVLRNFVERVKGAARVLPKCTRLGSTRKTIGYGTATCISSWFSAFHGLGMDERYLLVRQCCPTGSR